MISKRSFILFLICALFALFSSNAKASEEENPLAKFSKILPEKVGELRKSEPDKLEVGDWQYAGGLKSSDFNANARFQRSYAFKSPTGPVLLDVAIYLASSEESAYSIYSMQWLSKEATKCDIGTICFDSDSSISFVKGQYAVFVSFADPRTSARVNEKYPFPENGVSSLAKLIADKLESGEGDIPALVKHLPDWESVQKSTTYILNKNVLKSALRNVNYATPNGTPPIIEVVPFEAGTEAVVAKYGEETFLVIIEHSTPQIAADADERIKQKLNEHYAAKQYVPSAFKRVGNYSVFVFDAPDEATANNLINGIKYEKTVQWLNGDPYEYDRANRRYLLVAGGVIITVLKTSGLALLLCFLIGGFFGGLVFMHRRKQQAMQDAFTDAGGMLRLNLDELTPQTNPAKLLKSGDE